MIIFNDYWNFKFQFVQVYYFSMIKFKCILQFYQVKITKVKMWCNVIQKSDVSLLFTFQWQNILEKLLFGRFVSGYLLLITQIGCLCSWYSNLMYNDTSHGIFLVILIIWFFLKKNLKNQDFTWPTQIFKLLVWAAKVVKTHHSDVMGNCLPRWFKTANCKMLHLNFSDFFRQSSVQNLSQQSANAEAIKFFGILKTCLQK